jgi:RNA polymerase sigma-70 factor (ECF subfamily)
VGKVEELNDSFLNPARPEANFQSLMDDVRQGSQDAAWMLLETYGPHVHRVVRRMLSQELRPKFDSIDFVQSVWLSFFANRSQICDFGQPEQLIAFLAAMARNKVVTEVRRRLYTEKHNIRREQSLAAVGSQDITSRGPTPSDFAIARERWNHLVSGQPDHYRAILQMKYAGATNREIADRLGLNEKTIRRVIEKLLPLATA